MITEVELNSYAQQVYQQTFGIDFTGQVVWSKKMKNIAGNCRTDGRIALNYFYYERYGKEEIFQVLRHELVHKYLFDTIGLHTHSTPEFVELLEKVDGSMKGKPMPITAYIYNCPSCEKEWTFRKKLKTEKFACEDCSGGEYSTDCKIQFNRETLIEPANL